MTHKFLLIFAVVGCCGGATQHYEHQLLKGLAPFQRSLFSSRIVNSNQFRCLITGDTIPLHAINDDFCDCMDGTDEPGTSACSHKVVSYLQANEDVTPSLLRKWLRNLQLENSTHYYTEIFPTTTSSNQQNHQVPILLSSGKWRAADHHGEKVIGYGEAKVTWADMPPWGYFCPQKGARPKFIPSWKIGDGICDCCDGSDEMDGACEKNTCKEMALRIANEEKAAEEERAKAMKEWLRAKENGLGVLSGLESDLERLKGMIEAKESEIENLVNAEAAAKLEKAKADTENRTEGEDTKESATGGSSISEYAKWMEKEAPAGKEASEYLSSEDLVDDEDDYELDENRESQNEDSAQPVTRIHKLTSFVTQHFKNILSLIYRKRLESQPRKGGPGTRNDVKVVRTSSSPEGRISAARIELNSLKAELKRKEQLGGINGIENYPELISLFEGSCMTLFPQNTGGFTYEVCPFEKITQRDGGHSSINIGKFTKIEHVMDVSLVPVEYSTVVRNLTIHYEGGQTCGPTYGPRQSQLYFVCAVHADLLSAEEVKPCRYSVILGSPIACGDVFGVSLKEQTHHDEL